MGLMTIFKGFVGEALGSLAHKLLLDKSIYHELNNVTIPTQDGTTQIDHVIVSRYGIFVIEAKMHILLKPTTQNHSKPSTSSTANTATCSTPKLATHSTKNPPVGRVALNVKNITY